MTALPAGEREARLRAGLEAAGAAALVVLADSGRDPDLAPFVGDVHLGRSLLVQPVGGPPRLAYLTAMEREEAAASGLATLGPEELGLRQIEDELEGAELLAALLERALAAAGIDSGPLAVAGHAGLGSAVVALRRIGGRELLDGCELVRAVRKRKSAEELAAIRNAAAGAAAALRRVAAMLAAAARDSSGGGLALDGAPLTAGRLRREIRLELAARGLDEPHGNIVAAGAAAAVPHTRGEDDTVLAAGEAIIVDLYPRGRLFADVTRTFCVGPPDGELERAHAAVERALALAHRRGRPGADGWSLQEAVCELFAEAGYGTPLSSPGSERGYVHNLGHGVGYELHEQPSFRRGAGAAGGIEAGDVLTLEPGLYDPAAGWGVRLEDLCALTDAGLENLTPLPYALDPTHW